MSDDRATLYGVFIVILFFLFLVSSCQENSNKLDAEIAKEAIKSGLVQQQTAGGTLIWVRPKGK